MNNRQVLHAFAAIAAILAGGTVKFAGIGDIWTQNIAAVSSLVAAFLSVFLASTTTGVSK